MVEMNLGQLYLSPLYENLHPPGSPKDRPDRLPPWTWPERTREDEARLAGVVGAWVESWNAVYVVKPDDVIPPCWDQHPWLATELAVMALHWYAVHHDRQATITAAAEFYARYLPAFRDRLPAMLGRNPGGCRRGSHSSTWRKDADEILDERSTSPSKHDAGAITALATHTFGFSPLPPAV